MPYSQKTRLLSAAFTVMLLASGCSDASSGGKQQIDPPPAGTDASVQTDGELKQASDAEAASKDLLVTTYAKDDNGYIVPLTLPLSGTESVALKTLESMVAGATNPLPNGFHAVLPEGTKISVNIVKDRKLAVVDFSKAFASYKADDERKIMEALAWTLTGFPSVEHVELRMLGKTLTEMPVAHTPIPDGLSRTAGINLELAAGVNPGMATPVTVYFRGRTPEGVPYLVPVTRMIGRTDNQAEAAVAELLKGPTAGTGLETPFAAGTELLRLNRAPDSGTIEADIAGAGLGKDAKASAEAVDAVTLTLTENSDAAKVNITLKDGSSSESAKSRTVNRPSHINAISL
jgi:germination protein M